MSTNHDDHVQETPDLYPKDARFIYWTRPETLREAIRRRARLLWGWLRMDLDPDFDYEMRDRPFRDRVSGYRMVMPGDPDYDEANYEPLIWKCPVTRSAWIDLCQPGSFPDDLGSAIGESEEETTGPFSVPIADPDPDNPPDDGIPLPGPQGVVIRHVDCR